MANERKKMPLHIKIIIGMLLGVGWALLSSYAGWNQFTRDWVDPFGTIFIRLLKLIAIPLVLFSIISGVASLQDATRLGRTGAKTLGLYLITTMAAVTVGLVLVNVIEPGSRRADSEILKNRIQYEQWAQETGTPIKDDKRVLEDPAYAHLVGKSAVPDELVLGLPGDALPIDVFKPGRKPKAAAEPEEKDKAADESEAQDGESADKKDAPKEPIQYELWAQEVPAGDGDDKAGGASRIQLRARVRASDKIAKLQETAAKSEDQTPLQPLIDAVPENLMLSLSDGKLMLQVIVFAIFFGITMLTLPRPKMEPVIGLVEAINDIFVRMVELVMRAAPFFVFALMAGVMSKIADTPSEVISIFESLGWYAVTVVLGLAFMAFVFYPLVMVLVVRRVPYRSFFSRISPAQLMAFSTSSSAATLPVTMECVEDNLGVSKNMTSFVLPIGATVNMDGTSLYQAVAVIFLAQMHGVDLALGQQLGIIITATLASIGAAAVPSAGLIMLMIVLSSVGLNPAWIAIIFPIDRILDMCRTVVNVTGDATVCTIIAKTEGELDYPPTPKLGEGEIATATARET